MASSSSWGGMVFPSSNKASPSECFLPCSPGICSLAFGRRTFVCRATAQSWLCSKRDCFCRSVRAFLTLCFGAREGPLGPLGAKYAFYYEAVPQPLHISENPSVSKAQEPAGLSRECLSACFTNIHRRLEIMRAPVHPVRLQHEPS